jgi:pimeloyl-ACP methyl ester carboxylesterase
VSCPTLLVVGEESFHAGGAADLAADHPQARLVKVPQAGHWAPLDNPSGFVETMGRFLDQEG